MRLYNLQEKLLKSVQCTNQSGNKSLDITVTKYRDLVFTDRKDKSINVVNNTQIQSLITLRGRNPLYLYSSSSEDLMVTMASNNSKKSKVVRNPGPLCREYSGKTKARLSIHLMKTVNTSV